MKKFKKYLFWTISPLTFFLVLIFATIEEFGHFLHELMHKFEAWCFDYKSTGLIYWGDGIWSTRHSGDE